MLGGGVAQTNQRLGSSRAGAFPLKGLARLSQAELRKDLSSDQTSSSPPWCCAPETLLSTNLFIEVSNIVNRPDEYNTVNDLCLLSRFIRLLHRAEPDRRDVAPNAG